MLANSIFGQSNRIAFAKVGPKHLAPVVGYDINFMDRQTLKLIEDSVTDLQVIFPTCLSTVIRIREQCQMYCKIDCLNRDKCNCDQNLHQFDEYIKELELYVMRADVLRDKAKCTTELVSYYFRFQYNSTWMVNMY